MDLGVSQRARALMAVERSRELCLLGTFMRLSARSEREQPQGASQQGEGKSQPAFLGNTCPEKPGGGGEAGNVFGVGDLGTDATFKNFL